MSILDTIDGALRDYETSGDAMRWAPEGKRAAVAAADVPVFDLSGFAGAVERMAEAIRPVVEAQARMCVQFTHAIDRGFFPEAHRRCVT